MEIAGIIIALILVLIACIYFLSPTKKQEEEPKIEEIKEESKPKKTEKKTKKHSRTIKNVQQDIQEHPMLETILHGKKKRFGTIKGICCTDKAIAFAASSEQCVRICRIPAFEKTSQVQQISLLNMTPSAIALSNDTSYLAVGIHFNNSIRLFALNVDKSKKDEPFAKMIVEKFNPEHKNDVERLHFVRNQFLISSTSDDNIFIWNLNGQLLKTIPTGQLKIYCTSLSKSGNLLAAAGFTSDIKVFSVNSVEGDVSITKYRDLKGHTAHLKFVSFGGDDNRLASCSVDNTLKIFTLEEFKVDVNQKDIRVILDKDVSEANLPSFDKVVLAPNNKYLVVVSGKSFTYFVLGKKPKFCGLIENAHASQITSIAITNDSKNVITGGEDGIVKVWKLPPEIQ